jgi:arylsulfatase A-like enzyme
VGVFVYWVRQSIGLVVLSLFTAVAFATCLEVVPNRYLALGFSHTVAYLADFFLDRLLAPVGTAAFVGACLYGLGRARGWTMPRASALALIAPVSISGLASIGYVYNRYHTDVNWAWRREWNGIDVPGFLWETDVLLKNAGLILGAVLAGWVLYRVSWFVIGRMRIVRRAARAVLSHAVVPIGLGALLVLLPVIADTLRGRTDRPQNVIFICVDTLRADRLGCYGYDRPVSPTIDALAEESVRFEWAISQAEATLASHMSLFTSQIPSTHGVWNHHRELAPAKVTLAEVLREAGYRTGAFVDAGHLLGLFGFRQGFDRYDDRYKRLRGSVNHALGWIDGLDDDEQFFAFVHGYDVHTPYAPWSRYREEFVDPPYTGTFEPDVPSMAAIVHRKRGEPDWEIPLTDADVTYIENCYDAAIRHADDQVLLLLDGLRERDLLENTWIVLHSDHGEEFGEHGSFEHEKLYLPVTRVPLLIRPPDSEVTAVRGSRIGSPVGLLDLFPTVVEVLGLEMPADLEGRSLAPALRGEACQRGARVYSQNFRYGHQRAVTGDTLRVVSALEYPDSFEVYAFRDDPTETRPTFVSGGDERDGALGAEERRFVSETLEWMRRTGIGLGGTEAKRLLGSDFETLKSLGYIQ